MRGPQPRRPTDRDRRHLGGPAAIDAAVSESDAPPRAASRGTETVLVVEDVPAVLEVTREMLSRLGYHVLTAGTGRAALQVAAAYDKPIHLVLTDVVMPDVDGRGLAEQFKQIRPDTRVLFMSGYTDDAVVRHGILQEGIAYLQKPFTPQALAAKVRAVLEG